MRMPVGGVCVCVCVCVCVGGGLSPQHQQQFSRHQQGVLQFNSILTLSIWRQHQIAQVKDKTVYPPPTTSNTSQLQAQVVVCF